MQFDTDTSSTKVMSKEDRINVFKEAAKSGFHNKGINDANFVKMIYETNRKFKEVDSKLDELRV